MGKFEDHLWREFVRENGDDMAKLSKPETRHRIRRPRLVAGAGLAVAGGATALALVLSTATAPPAFAVTPNHDGTVTVVIRSASGIAGANAALHELGIRAWVTTSAPAGCQFTQAVVQRVPARAGSGTATVRWTIKPRSVATYQALVLTPPPAGSSGASGASGSSGATGASGSRGQVWMCRVSVGIRVGAGSSGPSGSSGASGASGNSGPSGNS